MIPIDHCQRYVEAGISTIPVFTDGSKGPAEKWNPFRTRLPSYGDLMEWHHQKRKMGLAWVCGVISGGLEVLDFDHDADETFDAWRRSLPLSIYGRLCVIETAGGGYHVPYRCCEVSGNHKIAMTADNPPQVLIESRGEGGYVVAVGSPPETHKSGRLYAQIMGEPLPTLPTFTPDERREMWLAAAAFDKRPDPMEEYVQKRTKELRQAISEQTDQSTPWGDFDVRASWDDILTPAGWTTSDGVHWTRPGKDSGVSAKVAIAHNGEEVLTVYSGNAGPLAPKGGGHHSHGKYDAFKLLHHGGDNREAARAARRLGYGGPSL